MIRKDKRVDIDIEIQPDGRVEFKVSGIKGKGCLEYAEAIKKALNADGDTEFTHEYYDGEVRIETEASEKIEGKVKTT
ncbi:MAG: DUF2997 domain-containing protein [Candidatus Coatesbacteria bacterium]|nr:DUF2997 domain-containing protein [Candidatus Coatesbacteria bacterium]